MGRRVPPRWQPASDPVARECGVVTVTLKRPMPHGIRCHYCAAPAVNRDHVVPDAVGGVDAWWNLVPSCFPCNSEKADRQACSCMFCVRAIALWGLGFRRVGMTRGQKKAMKRVEGVV